jgi:hypothetical protein
MATAVRHADPPGSRTGSRTFVPGLGDGSGDARGLAPIRTRWSCLADAPRSAPSSPPRPTTTVDDRSPEPRVIVDGTQYVSPAIFEWAAGTTHTISAEQTRDSSASGRRVRFEGWSDGGALQHTITTPAGPSVFTAAFADEREIRVNWNRTFGTVTMEPAAEDFFYRAGTKLKIRAEPTATSNFYGFFGDLDHAGSSGSRLRWTNRSPSKPASPRRSPSLRMPCVTPPHYSVHALSPGQIMTLFTSGAGQEAGTVAQPDGAGRYPTRLDGTEMRVNGVPAPLLFVSSRQVNFVMPFGLPPDPRAPRLQLVRDGVAGTGTAEAPGPRDDAFAVHAQWLWPWTGRHPEPGRDDQRTREPSREGIGRRAVRQWPGTNRNRPCRTGRSRRDRCRHPKLRSASVSAGAKRRLNMPDPRLGSSPERSRSTSASRTARRRRRKHLF